MGANELLAGIRTISLFATLIGSTTSVWILRRAFKVRYEAPLAFALFQAVFALMLFSLIALLTGGIYNAGNYTSHRVGLSIAEMFLAVASWSIVYALAFWKNGNSKGE